MTQTCLLCHEDIAPYVLRVLPASLAEIAFLRTLRRVCKALKRDVDGTLQDGTWMRRLLVRGAEFRGVVLACGPVPEADLFDPGIERLLRTEDCGALFEGMREFNADEQTQKNILARLRQIYTAASDQEQDMNGYLLVHPRLTLIHSATSDQDKSIAPDHRKLLPVVAWAMRTHPLSRSIQIDGVHILSCVQTEQEDLDTLTAYVLGSIAAVMHHNLQDLEVQRTCMLALIRHVYELSNRMDDSSQAKHKDYDRIDIVALTGTGVHNVPNLIASAMLSHTEDYVLHCHGSYLLWRYGIMMNKTTHRWCMSASVTRAMEDALLASLRRHSMHMAVGDTEPSCELEENCVFALQELIELDFANMQRIENTMQYTITAASRHAWSSDLIDAMTQMFYDIMANLDTRPLEKKQMQDFAAKAGIVHIYVMHLLAHRQQDGDLQGDGMPELSQAAFNLLTALCEGNAATTAQMVEADVMRTIDSTSTLQKGPEYHKDRNRTIAVFEQMLAVRDTGGAPTPLTFKDAQSTRVLSVP